MSFEEFKKKLIILGLLLLAVITGEMIYSSVQTHQVMEKAMQQEESNDRVYKTNEDAPVLELKGDLRLPTAKSDKDIKKYEQYYSSLVVSATDSKGYDIHDSKHLSHNEIDWTQHGYQELRYTLKDDQGNMTVKSIQIELFK